MPSATVGFGWTPSTPVTSAETAEPGTITPLRSTS
jgi:hypothetical protein